VLVPLLNVNVIVPVASTESILALVTACAFTPVLAVLAFTEETTSAADAPAETATVLDPI